MRHVTNVSLVLKLITFFLIIIPLEIFSFGCSHAEYKTEKQCCPMCAPGNHVLWHCTDDTSTTCAPCPELTFIDEPNGLIKCFACTVCDASRGLKLSKACTRTSDTVCRPMERFYCVDKKKGICIFAVPHSECKPGQYIKQAGTSSTDTVCADCTGDTYSNGSFSSCLPHTKCDAMGLTENKPGTHSSDRECGNSSPTTIIALSVTFFLVLITVVGVCTIWKRKPFKRSGIQKSRRNLDKKSSLPFVVRQTNVDPDILKEQVQLGNLNNPTETITVSSLNVSKQPEDIQNVQCFQEPGVLETKQKQLKMSAVL